MALKQVKNKITATKKTGQVTKAMESVYAVKMRKSQERAFIGRPYVLSAMRILKRISQSQEGGVHPLSEKRPEGHHLLVIVTSDKGLAGSVNSAVLKQAEERLTSYTKTDVIVIGRKAAAFAQREHLTVLGQYTNISDDVTLADVYEIAKTIMDTYAASAYSSVEIIYQNFISTFEQKPTSRKILPLDPSEIYYIMEGIPPLKGLWSDDRDEDEEAKSIDYTIEPSAQEVLDTLIPQLVQIMVYHALLESKASEHSARMVAMKNATDKSKEMVKRLTIKYNKERQAAITAEVSEITGGIEAMSQQ